MKTYDTSTGRKRHNSALIFSRCPVWNAAAILKEELRGFPQSPHPVAEILPWFDPDRVRLNPSQFVTHQLFYHRRYRELWSYCQRSSTNHIHTHSYKEAGNWMKVVERWKCWSVFRNVKNFRKNSQLLISIKIRTVQAEYSRWTDGQTDRQTWRS